MPPSRDGVHIIAIRSTRSGQPTASASAAFEPQSCPATMNRSMPSPSSNAMASIARMALLPARGVLVARWVPPNPRNVGTIVRSPAACKRGTTSSHVVASSGQPWSNSTGTPLRGPASS